jgi:hypothetical protein
MATKESRVYFFAVKARDRFGQDRKPNPGYNIYPAKVVKAAASYGAAPAWLVIRADRRDNTFCAYWGLIDEIPVAKPVAVACTSKWVTTTLQSIAALVAVLRPMCPIRR